MIEKIQKIIHYLISGFNKIDFDNGQHKKIIENNAWIKLTSTINQKYNEDENNINLVQYEDILKSVYNISNILPLYILQIIHEEEGMKIPKLEYEIYYSLNDSYYLTKLNLDYCKNKKADILISVKINEALNKYDPKSNYYNDLCYKETKNFRTDISLKDKINESIDINMTLCEENCELINYNYAKEKGKCSCHIKLSITPDYFFKN